jgi:hypothetical protein
VIIFILFSPNYSKQQFKKKFEIKFTYVTNDTIDTSIKIHIYHYTTPHEMVICERWHDTTAYDTDKRNTDFPNKFFKTILN